MSDSSPPSEALHSEMLGDHDTLDTTPEGALRQALRQNSQLGAAIGSLKSGVTITDPSLPDNPIIFANPGFYETTGYSPEEIIGYNCRFLQGPDTDPAIVQKLREAITGRHPFQDVILNYRKDGPPFL